MSTHDVPGANGANNDELAMGCWAEHSDGSMLFVESTEGKRIVYSMFDCSKDPLIEYRDAMAEDDFKSYFTWTDGPQKKTKKTPVEWTWHDKTPFPWDKVVPKGARDGMRFASADAQLSAAERVAESLKLRGHEVASDGLKHMRPQAVAKVGQLWGKIKGAIDDLLAE